MTKTETSPPIRNRWIEPAALLLILAAAAALRIHGVGFGLPALNDPDEPLFVMAAVDMLRSQSLNPHWFGHPGTITLYSIALVALAIGGSGIATGRFANPDAFVGAVYADPAVLFVPARLFFVTCGVACVWLTYLLGKRIGGARLGLIAAAFLAVNSVHIVYSQVIRTDVQASVFMLLCALSTVEIARHGRLRDYALAGMFVGLACATKWPAGLVAAGPLCVAAWELTHRRPAARGLAVFLACAATALFMASPYLLLDYPTAWKHLAAEARTSHPGATGGGALDNLGWYVRGPLLTSLGAAGLGLAASGLAILPLRYGKAALAILPAAALLFAVICAQALVWERWVIPLLPFLALAAAASVCSIGDRLGKSWFAPLAAMAIAVPMLISAQLAATERQNDTRQIASAWIRAHVPPGHTLLVEHAAFDLLQGGYLLRFPLGSAGCVDANAALKGRIRNSDVETSRAGRPLVDLGSVASHQLASCRADYAILTHWELYRNEPQNYAEELAKYRAITRRGTIPAVVRPIRGKVGGPVVYIVKMQ